MNELKTKFKEEEEKKIIEEESKLKSNKKKYNIKLNKNNNINNKK